MSRDSIVLLSQAMPLALAYGCVITTMDYRPVLSVTPSNVVNILYHMQYYAAKYSQVDLSLLC